MADVLIFPNIGKVADFFPAVLSLDIFCSHVLQSQNNEIFLTKYNKLLQCYNTK